MTNFLGLANFVRGIANGTVITSTPSLKLCEAAALNSYNGGVTAYNTSVNNKTVAGFLVSFDSII